MRIELAKLKMSHVRDFRIDPLEKDEAKILIDSITESGFWGGVVLTKRENGDYEVVAGHKRVYAAQEAGITHADLHVGKYDDQAMIRIYATENVTQRGEKSGIALAGAIASAARYLIKAILKGDKNSISQICDIENQGKWDIEHLKGNITSEKGLGVPLILKFYKGIDGIKESVVTNHLANLKASGDYARIVREVTEEIAQEQAEELAELERKQKEAEEAPQQVEEAKKAKAKTEKAKAKQTKTKETSKKATEAADKKKPTFDLAGVGKFLKTEHQIRVFRKVMEREAVQAHLPFAKQAEYAAMLVDYANKNDVELTAQFIDDYTTALIRDVGAEQGRINKQAMKEIEAENERVKWTNVAHHFCRNVGGVFRDAKTMLDMRETNPELTFTVSQELKTAIKLVHPKINELAKKLRIS